MKWLKSFLDTPSKVISAIVIAFLIGADFFAIRDIFVDARIPEGWVYAAVFSVALEGIPILLSDFLVKWREWKNETNPNVNDGRFSRLGFWVCIVGYVLLYGIVVFMRYRRMNDVITLGDKEDIVRAFTKNVLLSVSPLVTSIFAFGISWRFFRTSTVDYWIKVVKELEDSFHEKHADFLKKLYELQDAQKTLWTEVTENKTQMSAKLMVFRDEIFKRNKEKIMYDCQVSFQSQIERFNASVESELEVIIRDMEQRSSIPLTISDIKISDIVDTYDKTQPNGAGKWKYNDAKIQLETELINLIDNAIQVAQLKTLVYPIEEDKLT